MDIYLKRIHIKFIISFILKDLYILKEFIRIHLHHINSATLDKKLILFPLNSVPLYYNPAPSSSLKYKIRALFYL